MTQAELEREVAVSDRRINFHDPQHGLLVGEPR